MQAIVAHEDTGKLRRIGEDFDSTPAATWVEEFNGKGWNWVLATSQPFAEVLKEHTGTGWFILADLDEE
jgi:predicted mannosyl-3-phosphoglycerate phosphatase (HAD superfamily)